MAETDFARKLTLKLQSTRKHSGVPLKILRYKQVLSTNTTAYHLGEKGFEEWTVVVADRQTQGRGRFGHRWESPKGGLWFSILLKPAISESRLPILQFFAANAVRQSLKDETGLTVLLRWPNDLVLHTGKIGGILVEAKTILERPSFAVIGVGLNINLTKRQMPTGGTSTLVETRKRFNLQKLLQRTVDRMMSRYGHLDNPVDITNEWWQNCIHRPYTVEIASQGRTITGITRGLEENGALIVESGDREMTRVTEGTLRLVA